jgi:hypothetical protein
MAQKRTHSSERNETKRFLVKERDPTDYRDIMRPFELSDLVPPKPKGPSAPPGQKSRKGRGARERDQTRRREVNNSRGAAELSAHFAAKLNVADELREGFSLFGMASSVTTPPREVEIETATVREVVRESIRVAKAKVKDNFFEPEFEPALMHVTAHLVASKLQHAHHGAVTGSSHFEELPGQTRVLEHVRMAATTTMVGIAAYLEHIGRFDFDGVRYTPYLRRLMRNDNIHGWQASDLHLHHTPQIYSNEFRGLMRDPVHGTAERRAIMDQLGIPIPALHLFGQPIPPVPDGRDIAADLAIVRRHLDLFSQRFPKCIRAIDIAAGGGSRMQLVAYEPSRDFAPDFVWSPLSLEAMDLYVGAAFGFCKDRGVDPPLPPEFHRRVARSQIHLLVTGALSTWLNNLMSRG